jgi:hypothetical protein
MFEWQTLIGAVVGSVGALLVAEVVASSARWRELQNAAGILLLELERFRSAVDAILEVVELDRDIRSRSARDALSVVRVRPRLSSQFEAAAGRIVSLDPHLASLISGTQVLVDIAERDLDGLCDLYEAALRGEATGYSDEELFERLRDGLSTLGDAVHYIDITITRLTSWANARLPTWKRAWYHLRFRRGWDRLPRSAELPKTVVKTVAPDVAK